MMTTDQRWRNHDGNPVVRLRLDRDTLAIVEMLADSEPGGISGVLRAALAHYLEYLDTLVDERTAGR